MVWVPEIGALIKNISSLTNDSILCRKGYSTPHFTCVAEEKGEKVGQYWRWEFTMKVQTTDLTSGGTRVW